MILNRLPFSPPTGPAVDVDVEAAPEVVEIIDEIDADDVVAAGPVMKKLPAMGAPSPSSCANSVTLKPVIAVEAFTNPGAAFVKLSGCTKRSNVYL